jgi:hypothetical protein
MNLACDNCGCDTGEVLLRENGERLCWLCWDNVTSGAYDEEEVGRDA